MEIPNIPVNSTPNAFAHDFMFDGPRQPQSTSRSHHIAGGAHTHGVPPFLSFRPQVVDVHLCGGVSQIVRGALVGVCTTTELTEHRCYLTQYGFDAVVTIQR